VLAAPIPLHYDFAINCNFAGIALKIDAFKSWFKRHEKTIALSLAAVFVIIGIYFDRNNLKQWGLWLSFNDFVQTAGQFGTVGAFLIAFWQLRKSKEDAAAAIEREHQQYFFDQASTCLDEMSATINEFNPLYQSVYVFLDFLSAMNELAGTFKDVSEKITPGTMRNEIIRKWQSMYFSGLLVKLQRVDISVQLIGSLHTMTNMDIVSRVQKKTDDGRYLDIFRSYYYARFLLDELHPTLDSGLQSKLYSESGIFWLFKFFFFEKSNIEPFLAGTVNRPDMRAVAPAVAALYHKYSITQSA